MSNRKDKDSKYWLITIIKALLLSFPLFLLFTVIWFSTVWNTMTVNELLFHLLSPLEGTGESVLSSFFIKCVIPGVITWVLTILFLHYENGNKKKRFGS